MKTARQLLLFSLLLVLTLLILATPVAAGYGESGDPAGAKAPVCGSTKPAKPLLYYTEVVGGNGVKLVWDQNALASSWTVAYGVESGKYIYGVDRFGDNSSRSITISNLPNGTYYFVVRANNGCMPGPFSDEKVVRVGSGAAVTAPVAAAPVVKQTPGVSPKVTPKVTPTVTPKAGAKVTPTAGYQVPKVTTSPVLPTTPAASTPQPGFFQRIVNFFLGIFGR